MKKCFTQLFCVCLLVAVIAPFSAKCQVWTKVSGTNPFIHRIFTPVNEANKIVVASDLDSCDWNKTPMYFPGIGGGIQISTDSGRTFQKTRIDSFSVFDIYQYPDQPSKWIAAVRSWDEGGIIESDDAGETWSHNFRCSSAGQIVKMNAVPGSNKIVAAAINTDEGYKYSYSDFSDCQSISSFDIQARDIAVSKIQPNLMFIGGDDYFADGVYRSIDTGKTWEKFSSGLNHLRILCVTPSSVNPAVVYAGADTIVDLSTKTFAGKGIYMSTDTGKTWQLMYVINTRVFSIVENPNNPKYLAAACGTSGVYLSSCYGWGWEPHNAGLPSGSSIESVAIPKWDIQSDGFIVFAAVNNDGLYRSRDIIAGIDNPNDDQSVEIKSVYPMPVSDYVNISFTNDKAQSISIEIYDLLGNLVKSVKQYFGNGLQSYQFSFDNKLNSGYYSVVLRTENSVRNYKFIAL